MIEFKCRRCNYVPTRRELNLGRCPQCAPQLRIQAVLDASASEAARDEGMARAHSAADPVWKSLAQAAVMSVANAKPDFTSDDVWNTGLPKPREARALGPVLMRLAYAGHIEPTGEHRKTKQKNSHAAPIRVWRKKETA